MNFIIGAHERGIHIEDWLEGKLSSEDLEKKIKQKAKCLRKRSCGKRCDCEHGYARQ